MSDATHIPVLKEEVLHFLKPEENEDFIDCTAGEGGHSEAILEKNAPLGRVLAIEWDTEIFEFLKEKFEKEKRLVPVNESYTLIGEITKKKRFHPVSGILFDLGFSSFHIDESGRGFSFMRNEPLDMRYNKDNPLTAREIVNNYKEEDIKHILKKWGDEKYAGIIAQRIALERRECPIETTSQLAKIVAKAVPESEKKKRKINCATKTFQGLRIAVNGELLGLESVLPEAFDLLKPKGRMVIICFHEGEEKIASNFFKKKKREADLLTEDPVTPTFEEKQNNIRSRSAKLYALRKK